MNYKVFSEQRGNKMVSRITSSVQRDAFKNRRSVSTDSRSRGSYIPDRVRPSSEERESGNSGHMSRWSGARKSSLVSDAKRCTKDTRPLSDKAYQKKKVKEIAEFLEECDFKYPMTAAKLMSPSKRDFEIMFQFMYNYFDPLYEVKKLEEEAPKILKNFGYPFTVNKSNFVHVARTNWCNLLGILIWLMDLTKFAMKIDFKYLFESGSENDKGQTHPILFRYICQCYHDENDSEADDDAVFHQMIKSCMTEDVDDLEQKNKEKKLLLNSVEKEMEEIEKLSADKCDLEIKIVKFDDYLHKMESHYQKKNEICEKLASELKVKESECEQLQEEVSKKQDMYDAQGFDGKKQLEFFESQKKELLEKFDSKKNDVKELQDKLWESEIQFNQNLEKVKTTAESFNALYSTIVQDARSILNPLQNVNVPQLQKMSSSFHLDFPDFVMQPNKFYSEWSNSCKSTLESIEDKISRTKEILERTVFSLNQKHMELQVRHTEISTQLKAASFKKGQTKHDLDLHIKEAVDESSLLEAQCGKITETLNSVRGEMLKSTDLRKEMSEELEKLKAFEKKKENDLKEYLDKKKNMFEYCLRMERKVLSLQEECGNEIAAKLDEFHKYLK